MSSITITYLDTSNKFPKLVASSDESVWARKKKCDLGFQRKKSIQSHTVLDPMFTQSLLDFLMDSGSDGLSISYPPLSINKKIKREKREAKDPLNLNLKQSSMLTATTSSVTPYSQCQFLLCLQTRVPSVNGALRDSDLEASKHGLIPPSQFTEEREAS